MKKIYSAPETTLSQIETEQMIANSLDTKSSTTDHEVSGGGGGGSTPPSARSVWEVEEEEE